MGNIRRACSGRGNQRQVFNVYARQGIQRNPNHYKKRTDAPDLSTLLRQQQNA